MYCHVIAIVSIAAYIICVAIVPLACSGLRLVLKRCTAVLVSTAISDSIGRTCAVGKLSIDTMSRIRRIRTSSLGWYMRIQCHVCWYTMTLSCTVHDIVSLSTS